jgi:hypothetical protein
MALFKEVKCGRCDRRYSALRSRCPHCGARKNRDGKATTVEGGTRWQVIVGAVVLLAIIAAAVILITTSLKNREPEPGGNTKPPATVAPSGVHVVDGTDPTPTALPGEEPTPTPTAPPTPSPTPEPMVNSITLSRSDFTLSHIGEQYTIQATISPAGTKVNIVWISEDPDVATVDENGTVTAVDHGTTKVSATAGGVIQECIVRVSAYAPSGGNSSSSSSGNGTVSLSHYDVTIHSAKSETFKLSVKGAGDNAVISYSSGNSSVASVSSDGTVKAVGNGNTDITVTVTVNGETSELKCKVYVVN